MPVCDLMGVDWRMRMAILMIGRILKARICQSMGCPSKFHVPCNGRSMNFDCLKKR